MLKVWNMFLVIGTFSAVMFATFATRSGLIESVHSFAQSEIGMPMFLFWAGLTLISVGLILWRWNRGELRDEHRFQGILSREVLFVLNNVVFVALALAVFWGSFGAPIVSILFMETEITLGREYFEAVTVPLFLVMFVLMGIAPLSAWGVTAVKRLGAAMSIPVLMTFVFLVILVLTGMTNAGALLGYGVVALAGFVALYEIYRAAGARMRAKNENAIQATVALFTRNRRRYGGYVVHLGVVVIGIGIIGSTLFQVDTQRVLNQGGSLEIGDYALRYNDLTFAIASDGRDMTIADVTVLRNGQEITTLRPRVDHFPDMPMMIAAAHSTLENDFYVLLTNFEGDATTAQFWVYINPLVNLIWWGSFILILGTVISTWPNETVPVQSRERRRTLQAPGSRAEVVA